MDQNKQKIVMAGEEAFQVGLAKARARGGPVQEIDSLCRAGGVQPPSLISGEKLSRMTLGIQRLLQKRASMPDSVDVSEILLFFARGPEVAELFTSYDEEAQAWTDVSARQEYEEMVHEADTLTSNEFVREIGDWLNREITTYNRLTHEDGKQAGGTSAASGSDGSRVGWWLRAAEGICAHYAAACPPGRDLTTWAVWEFPINDYLALQPAAHERSGRELSEHYSVKEARLARRAAKRRAEAEAAAPPPSESPAP